MYLSTVINELLGLKGSHINQHSGFEETELEGKLNPELCYRSKSAKVGMENLWVATSEAERQAGGVLTYLMVLLGGSCRGGDTVTFSRVARGAAALLSEN